jgi:hypothetical protein
MKLQVPGNAGNFATSQEACHEGLCSIELVRWFAFLDVGAECMFLILLNFCNFSLEVQETGLINNIADGFLLHYIIIKYQLQSLFHIKRSKFSDKKIIGFEKHQHK